MFARCSTLLLVLALWAAVPAAAQITLSEEKPEEGRTVSVTVPPGVDTLRVTYRPSSSIPHVELLSVSGGVVAWTPQQAGVVRLAVSESERRNVSVRFQTLPVSGIVVLLLAGAILFGGCAYAFSKLFGDDTPRRA